MRGMFFGVGSAVLALAGCAGGGVQPGGDFPHETFAVNTDYEAAFRRANEFFRVCHVEAEKRYGVQYLTQTNVDRKGTLATIQLAQLNQAERPMMIFESEPDGPRQSKATITVYGPAPWDAAQIAAVRQSVQTATPVCREGAPGAAAGDRVVPHNIRPGEILPGA